MLDGLETFLAVAQAGSFSQVAKDDGLSVSSVTRRIDLLEATVQIKLFVRTSRRLTLTDAGEHLVPRARQLVADAQAIREGLAGLDEARGVLTVTAPAQFGRRHVVPAIGPFLRQHPEIEIDLHLGDEILDLAERRVDVAIRIGRLPDSDLTVTGLAPLIRFVCASPDYLRRAGVPATPAELVGHDCLTFASVRPPAGWWSFPSHNGGAPIPVTGRFRSDDTGALLEAAIAGIGLAHLASWLVADHLASGALVRVLADVPGGDSGSAIHAVRMPGRSSTAKSRLFIAHLRKSFGSPPSWDAVS